MSQSVTKNQHQDNAWSQLARDLQQWVHEQVFALSVTAGFIVINLCWWLWFAAQHKALPYNELTTNLRVFDLAKVLPSLFVTRSVFQLIVEALLMLLVLCLAEPMLGWAKTVLVCVVSAFGGVTLGLLLCAGISYMFRTSYEVFGVRFTLSPVMLVVGALMAASAFARPLWRRRIRIVGYTAILVVLLYGGNPGDYCTLLAAIIGQLLGRALAGKPRGTEQWHWQFSSSYEVRRIVAAIGVVLALGPIVATTSRSHAGPLTSMALLMSPESVNSGKLAACMHGVAMHGCFKQYELVRASMPGDIVRSLLPLIVMLILAWGVYLGRRTAAIASIVFYGLAAVITVCYYVFIPYTLNGASYAFSSRAIETCIVNTLIPLLYAICLLVEIHHFSIHTKEKNLWVGIVAVVSTFVVCSAIYLLFVGLRPQDFAPQPTFSVAFAELPGRFLPIGFLTHTRMAFLPITATASFMYQGIGILFWIVLIIACFAWMNASVVYDRKSHESASELVEDGGESMSFMATWEGNDYWVSSSGRSAIGYRVLNRIALTTTGPFGDPDEWMDDLDEFSHFCSERSWSPVFYAIHEEAKHYLQESGWHSIMVGQEMLIDPQSWKTTGKKWQDVRTAVNKAHKLGITDEFTIYDDAPTDVQQQIEEISEQWSQGKALPEMKFTLGGVEELKDPRVKILYAIDEQGTVQGVTSWLPTWRDGRVIGYTLDFMRYRKGSYNGIMEFLIARMAQRMHDQGVEDPDNQIEFVSLSAAPLTGLHSETDATSDDDSNITGTTLLQHSMALVADLLEPAYGFRSLYNFKKKFQPSERPVYISYADSALLANLGIAIIRAYLPTLTVREALGMLTTFKPEEPKEKKDKDKEQTQRVEPKDATAQQ